MKRTLLTITLAVLVLSITPVFGKRAATSPSPDASAAPNASASPAGSPAARIHGIPFHGMIASVDAKTKTFTISGKKDGSRVFKISDQTAITKTGAPATMKDLVENEEIRGTYLKEADGSLVAKMVKVGPLTEQEKAALEARKQRRTERRAARAATAPSASPGVSATPAASASPKP